METNVLNSHKNTVVKKSVMYETYYAKGFRAFNSGIAIDDIEDNGCKDDEHSQKIFDESWSGWTDGWKAAEEKRKCET